ncbi:MAG: hypothetical protein IIU02_01850, partial [Treponema sp.]|nr:hypothetical protein [Treponema sp.]
EMAIQFNLAVFMPTAGNNFYLDRGYRGGNWGSYVGEEFKQKLSSPHPPRRTRATHVLRAHAPRNKR